MSSSNVSSNRRNVLNASSSTSIMNAAAAGGGGGGGSGYGGYQNNTDDPESGVGGNNDNTPTDSESEDSTRTTSRWTYDWRLYSPRTKGCLPFLRWLVVGGSSKAPQSDEELNSNLRTLARCLMLLREYLECYGMPERGGVRDQEYVLRKVYTDLYAGGAPIWALEPVMQKAAEGLTGQPNVNWLLLPRKAFIFAPTSGATIMFKVERGSNISKLDAMEKVAVRLCSFASNTRGANSVPSRVPTLRELYRAFRFESVPRNLAEYIEGRGYEDRLARRILSLASKAEGLVYFANEENVVRKEPEEEEEEEEISATISLLGADKLQAQDGRSPQQSFWVVSKEERELFSRLATIEAMGSIDRIAKQTKTLYSPFVIKLFYLGVSVGSCVFWFSGSWPDIIVGGFLGLVVSFIKSSTFLSMQERIVIEIVASFVVGISAGLIALAWPDRMCFAAMALAAVINILQGFRVVYAIVEIMSKHTVAGGADLLEGILFTGLIAYFLRFGQYVAADIMGNPKETTFAPCTNGIGEWWYLLFVPLASLSWSGLFNPNYVDLPLMCLHGVMGYVVTWGLAQAGVNDLPKIFLASLSVSLFAGITSRFTGRQAVGNTVAGLYVLVPGAYLVKSLYSSEVDGSFFLEIIQRAVAIGIGAWTGTLLCSPTLLGTTRGLISQQQSLHGNGREQMRMVFF